MSAIIPIGILAVLMVAAAGIAAWLRPKGEHACPRRYLVDVLESTLPALPAPQSDWQPRAVPDVPRPVQALSEALGAQRHPCYQYAARLAAMSWQSHKTLQRNYDVLAFATVAKSYYRMGMTYA